MKKCKLFILLVFFFLYNSSFCFFISKPEEKARKYLKLSLEEYKKAIKENPNNFQIIDEYKRLLEYSIGKTEAKIELLLLFKEIGLQEKVNELLLDVILSDSKNALSYIEKRIEKSQIIDEKINLYSIATELAPQEPLYWFNLGKLLIGINREKEGIEAFEKAYIYNLKDVSLFYYLALNKVNKGDYKSAKSYIKEGLEISDDISLHKLLLKIYLLEGDKEMARKEKEQINNLIALKKEKKVEKVEERKIREKIEGLNPYYFIGVSKDEQKLYIGKFDGYGLFVIGKYNCSTGSQKGDKQKQGDKRTPEGAYLLTSKIEGPSLPSKYGICAFPLNYPDPIDKRLNKDGNGIWLHATPIEKPPYSSQGCIVINDNNMKEIMEYIKVGKTFICIFPDNSFLNFRDFKDIKEVVEKWKIAWESKDIDRYIGFYDDNFLSGGKNKKSWRLYKENINKGKKYIKVDISDLQILPYGKTELGFLAIAFFNQKYKSDNFTSTTKKILYLVKRDINWKIICEYTF